MITLSNVSAGYDGVPVLKNISFSLLGGQNLSILGPNGCGKTTLLRAMSALIPFEGSISMDGQAIHQMKRKELASKIAVMSQISNVYFSYTVFETVMLGRYQHFKTGFLKTASASDYEYAEHCLEIVGLQKQKNRQLNTLSGGQLQRAFLAKALAQQPDVILLDEPTNHLDLKHQVELISYLKEWGKDKNHSVIGVFHDINLALLLTDDILVLKDGELAGFGNYKEIMTSDFLKQVYSMDVVEYMKESLKKWG